MRRDLRSLPFLIREDVKTMEKEKKKWDCTACGIEFEAPKKENEFLPDCPSCKIDYRVFELKD